MFDPITIATRGGALHYLVARTGQGGRTQLSFHTDSEVDPPRFARPGALESICDSQRPAVAIRAWDYGTRLAFARNLVNLAAVKIQYGGVPAADIWSVLNEADDQFVTLIETTTRRGDEPFADALIGLSATRYNCAVLAIVQGTFRHVASIADNAKEVLAKVPYDDSPREHAFLVEALGTL
jgi:hypothetical protein